jgi:hypothetical protein
VQQLALNADKPYTAACFQRRHAVDDSQLNGLGFGIHTSLTIWSGFSPECHPCGPAKRRVLLWQLSGSLVRLRLFQQGELAAAVGCQAPVAAVNAA